ncbi:MULTISPECIES: GreA/GreB family elongation factor [unclassified Variovorax]|uniref:GreA/GreB family elongation factor n=1 Tax=unclassified Variovorax TaxID=663243 RepID=UPI00131899EF|nr:MULTISPECIES: GreA/GreB family elongation factor [unclassified Variovorax]VTU17903.1 Regulator of nucleoside diphosphate kinase [Variovorax sp. SRS16]VTU26502.1 Regulator of nucleoside diphosphate kinase [Variovorax sp. PBL-E5]
MPAIIHGERTLTELDHVRLSKLRQDGEVPPEFEDLLDATEVVRSREVAPDIVTMNSQVQLTDRHSGQRQQLTLCYPRDAAPGAGLVSVLSPVGMALIGLRLGATARWQTPSGEQVDAEVVGILYQPEASGDYTR